MRWSLLCVPLLLSPALLGCLDPGVVDPTSADVPGVVLPYLDMGEEHDHTDLASHDAGWNVETLGWNGLAEGARANDGVVHGDLAFVSLYEVKAGGGGGLAIVDVSDPAAPVVVGTYETDRYEAKDVDVSEDGQYVILSGQRMKVPVETPDVPCTAVPIPGQPVRVCEPFPYVGVELIDVSDPSDPQRVAWYDSAPSGSHTAKLATIGGELYAFISNYGVYAADRTASHVDIVRFDATAPTGFVEEGRFAPSEPSGAKADGSRVFVHEVVVDEHPITGDWLMYVAYWDGGFVLANVNDPAAPEEVAVWKDFDPLQYGNIHYALPMPTVVDGRHYTVVAPEFGSAEHAGETYLLDTTDPAHPVLVTRWTIPGDPLNPGDYMHSPHNFDLTDDGLMVMAHYHAGVWVVDLAPAFAGREPAVLGYRFPVPSEEVAIPADSPQMAPAVWAAVWMGDGRIMASDMATGLFVLEFEPTEGASPPYAGLV